MESEDPEVAVNGAAAVPSGSVGVKILSIVVEEWEPPAETEEEEERAIIISLRANTRYIL